MCGAREGLGAWCYIHRIGHVAGVPISSLRLYEAVDTHGHEVDLTTFSCPACQRAIATDGVCAQHRVAFQEGRAYFTLLTYYLARGEPREPAALSCPACRKASEDHGWCDGG